LRAGFASALAGGLALAAALGFAGVLRAVLRALAGGF
jgi:hypothetical protein